MNAQAQVPRVVRVATGKSISISHARRLVAGLTVAKVGELYDIPAGYRVVHGNGRTSIIMTADRHQQEIDAINARLDPANLLLPGVNQARLRRERHLHVLGQAAAVARDGGDAVRDQMREGRDRRPSPPVEVRLSIFRRMVTEAPRVRVMDDIGGLVFQKTGKNAIELSRNLYNRIFAQRETRYWFDKATLAAIAAGEGDGPAMLEALRQNCQKTVGGYEFAKILDMILAMSEDNLAYVKVDGVTEISREVVAQVRGAARRLLGHDRSSNIVSKYVVPHQKHDEEEVPVFVVPRQWSKYVEENPRDHSCLFDVIIDTFKEALEAFKNTKQWLKQGHKMTYDGIVRDIEEVARKDPKSKKMFETIDFQDGGYLTLEQAVKHFFRPLQKGVRVLDVWGHVVFGWCPEMEGGVIDHNWGPRYCNLLLHENHVWILNNKVASFEQLYPYVPETKSFKEPPFQLKISDKFALHADAMQEPTRKLARTAQDVVDAVKEKGWHVLYWHDPVLNTLLEELVSQMSRSPVDP